MKASSTVDAYWVGAWAQLNKDGKIVKIFCERNAANAEEARKVLAKAPIPLEGVYPMMRAGAEDYR